ncbi:UDP binding domain-containing protein [Dictyobacter kobayashii]|uniref:UDP-glucose/GDP-mannose dehydrogenase C-terminal domain-containing protein n=1 Tax=Dictyobacter kobayashii TaxID=2014872 RepID=A0A402ASJ8_9CHLR|nr:UDP binding domain-containing protein [Dictyobacter kobayashii]GCE22074.1 hypothetical protein KDK_58740 [Dictyobacter kobayashii]
MRGSPVTAILELLADYLQNVVGHDYIVSSEQISALGVKPVSLEEGFQDADVVFILNDHRNYRSANIEALVARMQSPAILFDAWGMFAGKLNNCQDEVKYMRLSWTNAY